MDFNGNAIGTISGGINDITPSSGLLTVDGDCKITGDLDVLGSIVSDINVTDAIIAYNRNAPADTLNQGLYGNSNANTAFSGLVRSRLDKAFYLFNLSSTVPSPLSTITDRNGALKLGALDALSATLGAVGAQYSMPSTTAGAVVGDPLVYSSAGAVSIQGLDQLKFNGYTRASATATQTYLRSASPDKMFMIDDTKDSIEVTNRSNTQLWLGRSGAADAANIQMGGIFIVGGVYGSYSQFAGVSNADRLYFTSNKAELMIQAVSRFELDNTSSRMFSPSGSAQSRLELKDASAEIKVGGITRMTVSANSTVIKGEPTIGNTTYLILGSNAVTLERNGVGIVSADPAVSKFCGVTNADYLQFSASAVDLKLLGATKFTFGTTGTTINGSTSVLSMQPTFTSLARGGVNTLYADATVSKLSGLTNNDSFAFSATGASLTLGTLQRLTMTTTTSQLFSGDLSAGVTLANGSVNMFLGGGWYAFGADVGSGTVYISSPNNATTVLIADDYVNFRVINVDYRIKADGTESSLYSPNATSYSKITNTQYVVNVASAQRILVDGADTRIISPNGANRAIASNAKVSAEYAGVERFTVDVTGSTIASPSQTSYFSVVNASAQAVVGSVARGVFDATSSRLVSPDNAQALSVGNTGVTWGSGANSNLLPTGRGTAGQRLQTDGAGAVSWADNTLAALSNVTAPAPADLDTLLYDTATAKWVSRKLTYVMPHGEIYYCPAVGVATNINSTVQGTKYLINPVTTLNASTDGFDSPSAGRLRYTGTKTLCFHCVGTVSIKLNSLNNKQVYVWFYKNGSLIDNSHVRMLIGSSTDYVCIAIHQMVELAQNGYVELFVSVETAGVPTLDVGTLNIMAMGMGAC